MKTLFIWIIIFVFGFVVGAWAGFKVLEWVSSDLLLEAWDNSYQEFQKTYPWSTAQNQLNQKVEEQKWILLEKLKNWLKDQLVKMFSFGTTNQVSE
jgi:hypothetical protein